jgi:hypothetical protein
VSAAHADPATTPATKAQWVEKENATTASLQQQAEAQRLQEAAKTCARLATKDPGLDIDSCIADPAAAQQHAIARENAKREAEYARQEAEYKQQQETYQKQMAEYQQQRLAEQQQQNQSAQPAPQKR